MVTIRYGIYFTFEEVAENLQHRAAQASNLFLELLKTGGSLIMRD